jgi:basic membrane protein A
MHLWSAGTRRFIAALALLFVFAGCGGSDKTANRTPVRVGMVTDVGGLGDKSFNDSAYHGLVMAKSYLGVNIQVLESKSAADYQPNLTALAQESVAETFAVGFLMSKDLSAVARRFRKQRFSIIDAVVPEPNVTSITFREQEGSFLAGALAAMVSKTKTIGFLGGMDVPLLRKFEAGYIAGAHQIDPNVKVLVKYVGSFEDVASGKELASVLFNAKADVVYVAAGKSGLGAINETRARSGVYAIGVDSNQDALAPGKILTSVLKRVDVAVYRVVEGDLHGTRESHIELSLKDAGVDLTDFKYTRPVIGDFNIIRLRELRAAIVSGKIVPPQTREELVRFKPVSY